MSDVDDLDQGTMYALTWHSPEGHPYYWSLKKGWTPVSDHAWALSEAEVESIEEDDRLLSRLPQSKECRDGANWEPIYRRFTPYAPGVIDDDV